MNAITAPTGCDGAAALPAPWRITFDTNPDDCNLACVMCEEHSDLSERKQLRMLGHRSHRRMDIAVLRMVVAEMAPQGLREIIPSTMGEPLLFAHFEEILAICHEYGVLLNLTTNGTWPHYGPERWGELICPVTSDVKVSWNGSHPGVQESIMRGSDFQEGLQALRTFIHVRDRVAQTTSHRCRVTLQCTFMERNLPDLPRVVELASGLGVDRVKGHHLWVHFKELNDQDLRRNPESRRRWNATLQECLRVAERCRPKDGSPLMLDNFLPLSEADENMPEDWVCPFLGREAWVNHAGRFDPCCAPDAERAALGDFGKVQGPLGMSGIWQGAAYRTLFGNYKGRPVCRKCTLRRPVG